ncbi:MAG: GH3 auxin-responsive promoter family protein, partial [Planctomycetota bacterium]
MSKSPGRMAVFASNAAWLASCLPGWLAFRRSVRHVRKTQETILFRTLRANRATDVGRRHGFDSIRSLEDFRRLPLTDYADYETDIAAIADGRAAVLTAERVELLQPTGGSTSGTKLIPYTATLRQEFRAAIDPWIAGLLLRHPRLLSGRHYWSISPNSPCDLGGHRAVRVGFADDSEYLGLVQRRMVRGLFAVPPEIRSVEDPEAFRYLTLLFLLRERNLRLVSVWHPSFMTLLLEAVPRRLGSLVDDIRTGSICPSLALEPGLRETLSRALSADPERADELGRTDGSTAEAAWPRLEVVSCWTDGWSRSAADRLQARLPQALLQGKGLVATEGVVSFPFGTTGRKVCAIRSHFLEFLDAGTGDIRFAWELERGRTYSVVLTTGGGLYRYRLHDQIRVTDFIGQAPCLEFVSRDNLVSDLVGEKLDLLHVETSLHRAAGDVGVSLDFGMLAPLPRDGIPGYVFYLQTGSATAEFDRLALRLEQELCRN